MDIEGKSNPTENSSTERMDTSHYEHPRAEITSQKRIVQVDEELYQPEPGIMSSIHVVVLAVIQCGERARVQLQTLCFSF